MSNFLAKVGNYLPIGIKPHQNIYQAPIPAEMGYPLANSSSNWKMIGFVMAPFGAGLGYRLRHGSQPHQLNRGTTVVKYPLEYIDATPHYNGVYIYRVVVGNRYYYVKQTYKVKNGDVIDVLGFMTPMKRWRVNLGRPCEVNSSNSPYNNNRQCINNLWDNRI